MKQNQINIFYPKNIYGLIVSLSFEKKINKIIFLNKKHFSVDQYLMNYLMKKYDFKFFNIQSFKQIITFIKKISNEKAKNQINLFHKEDNLKIKELKTFKVSHFFLEHGIGNYYNFVTTSIFSTIINLIRNRNKSYFKFYAGVYANLKNNIYIRGKRITPIIPIKISKVIKDLFLFHLKQSDHFKDLRKVFLKNTNILLINFPDFLSFNETKNFLKKLNNEILFKNRFCIIKFHPKYNQKNKYLNFIKIFCKKSSINYLILNKRFNFVPFELLVPFSKNAIIYSAISNIPFVSSMLFENKIFTYVHLKTKKKFNKYNELKKNSFLFYKKNFTKIHFI